MQILAYWCIQIGKLSFIILKLQGFGKESVAANGFILSGSIFLIVCMGCEVFGGFCFVLPFSVSRIRTSLCRCHLFCI